MKTVLDRTLLLLEERMPGLKVLSVQEIQAEWEEQKIAVYYNAAIAERDEYDTDFGPTMIEELRKSSVDILDEM